MTAPAAKVRLLRRRFLNRVDRLAFRPPWDQQGACPMEGGEDLDAALLAHVLGAEAPAVAVRWVTKKGKSGTETGRFRLGSYSPGPGGVTAFACVDCDGGGRHGHPLADPLGVALRILDALAKAGLIAHLECSGSGTGWHCWLFFAAPVPAAKVRRLLLALLPKDAPLKNGGCANAASNRGLEIFPKQADGDLGNQVWLPWWSGAAEGGNLFYQVGDGGEVATYDPKDFETVSEADLDRALAALPAPEPNPTRKVFTYEGGAATRREKALLALTGLSAARADGYDDWLHVGMALHSVDPSVEMLGEWERWSRSCPDKFKDGECAKKWASFDGGGGVSLGTLIHMAKQDGWMPPGRQKAGNHNGGAHANDKATARTDGAGQAEGARAESNHNSGQNDKAKADDWPPPIPFDAAYNLPSFPTHLLPAVLRQWVEAEALATQTPADLAGTLALSVCAAALAGKIRVVVREGWAEPVNVFTVVALPPGERKSIVHRHALIPVVEFERQENERMAPVIAEAASEHRMMEARLKATEQKAAKEDDPTERQRLRHEAKRLAKELTAHVVPEPPQLFCDDVTPEALGRLLAKQGGRMLQASPEGTAIEIVKGRYSESPNFDVYLKGHAGDPLRVGRIGRDGETVDRPALSTALAVQPDVICGLAAQAILRGRGFLARWLYSMPLSKVGNRVIAARPIPKAVEAAYREAVLRLWRLEGAVEDGKPAAHLLRLSADADRLMQDFERWLEPQLAEGEELSLLAGWANKLAGAAARIAGSLHVLEALSGGRPWDAPISAETVGAAVALARDYFLPHAQAAFAVMGADGKIADARHVWASVARRRSEFSECSENGVARLSRRDIHQWNRRRFPTVEALDPVLSLLVDRYYLRPVGGGGQPGRGHASPAYEVSPLALAAFENEAPRTHCTHCTHSDPESPPSECSENSESAPRVWKPRPTA